MGVHDVYRVLELRRRKLTHGMRKIFNPLTRN